MSEPQWETFDALAAPFDPMEVEWKPAVVSGNRAMAIAYVDARVVMDRLDQVLGLGNWATSYRELESGVVCRLRVKIDGEWVEHEDVGSYSDQPDAGDKLKAGFSDALKRVAVHLGIARYLYRLPAQWVDYDPQRKQFAVTPRLPDWAIPGNKAAAPKKPKATPKADRGGEIRTLPANGPELQQRVHAFQDRLVKQGLCEPGDLDAELVALAREMKWNENLETWNSGQIKAGAARIAAFQQQREAAKSAAQPAAAPPAVAWWQTGPRIVAAQWDTLQTGWTKLGRKPQSLLTLCGCQQREIPTAWWQLLCDLVDHAVNLDWFRQQLKVQTLTQLEQPGIERAVKLVQQNTKQIAHAS